MSAGLLSFGRKIPHFSLDEILARGQVPVEKLVINDVYWCIPGSALFIVKRIGKSSSSSFVFSHKLRNNPLRSVIEGRLDLVHWRQWFIEQPGDTYLYPVSDVERSLLKDIIEDGKRQGSVTTYE